MVLSALPLQRIHFLGFFGIYLFKETMRVKERSLRKWIKGLYDQNFSSLTCSKQWPETDSEGEKSRDASMDQGEVVRVEK